VRRCGWPHPRHSGNPTGFYISTGYTEVPGLLLVLAFKPAGVFGKAAIKKV
jgi:branched-chain amino acid transport system permease protein